MRLLWTTVCQRIGWLRRDKFLETYNLPRLDHEEIKNLNTLTNKKIELATGNSQRKTQDQMVLLENSTKHLKKN